MRDSSVAFASGAPLEDRLATGLDALRDRITDAVAFDHPARQRLSAVVISRLAFARVLGVQWLADESFTRDQVRAICVDALYAVLPAQL